jgi:hypothetical protein
MASSIAIPVELLLAHAPSSGSSFSTALIACRAPLRERDLVAQIDRRRFAASTPSPAAKRGAASAATESAVG